uniref:Uncharacterized protein n=1 Tax=Rhizophora mucronata TaxID=61149 RepID=A0A2P2LZ45_RHIMU
MAGELAAVGSSIASAIKAYAMPLFLLSLSMFYQLVVIPRSFPPSHYDGLFTLIICGRIMCYMFIL